MHLFLMILLGLCAVALAATASFAFVRLRRRLAEARRPPRPPLGPAT